MRCVECENTYDIIEVRRVREYIYMARVCVLRRTHLRCAAHSVCRV